MFVAFLILLLGGAVFGNALEVQVGKYLTLDLGCTIETLSAGTLYNYTVSGLGNRLKLNDYVERAIYFANMTQRVDTFLCGSERKIDVFNPCPLFQPYSPFGNIRTIPTPYVHIAYHAGEFLFNISTYYVRGIRYYSGFRNMDVLDPCDNQKGEFSLVSAPHAEFPGAFDYPAYDYKKWNILPEGCDRVDIYAKFSTSEFANCGGIAVTKPPQTPFITYEGTYRAEALTTQTSNLGRWNKNFRFQFNVHAHSVVSIDYERDVEVVITNMYVDERFHLHLRTTVQAGKSLTALSHEKLELMTVPSLSEMQNWHYRSIAPTTFLNETIRLEWTLNPDGRTIPIDIDVNLKSLPDVDETYAFSSILETYMDDTFTTPYMGPFTTSQPIYILARLQDFGIFNVRIANVWVCNTDDAYFVPHYHPDEGKYGCSREVPSKMDSSNIHTLIEDGEVVDNEFETQKYTVQIPNAVGISIGSLPIISGSKVFYLHVELEILLTGGDVAPLYMRKLLGTSQGHAMSAIYVVPPSPVDKTGIIVGATIGAISLLAIIVFAIAGIVSITTLSIAVWRIHKQKIQIANTLSIYKQNLPIEDSYDTNSLESILLSTKGIEEYMQFCKKTHCLENLLFWMAVYNYKLLDTPMERAEVAKNIYNLYISPAASFQVNIPGDMVEEIRISLLRAEVEKSLFDHVQGEILHLMKTHSYVEFRKTHLSSDAV